MVITADRCNDHPTGAGGTNSFAQMVRRFRPTGHTGCVMQSFLSASRQARKLKTTLRLIGMPDPQGTPPVPRLAGLDPELSHPGGNREARRKTQLQGRASARRQQSLATNWSRVARLQPGDVFIIGGQHDRGGEVAVLDLGLGSGIHPLAPLRMTVRIRQRS